MSIGRIGTLCFFLILLPLPAMSSDDTVYQQGMHQGGLSIFYYSHTDYFIFTISPQYGYFFLDNFIAGTELGLHFASDNMPIYEPSLWCRFFVINRRPAMPFLGIDTGIIFSPNYTYKTSYSAFTNATVTEEFVGEEADDTLSIFRVSPNVGINYFINQNVSAVGIVYYNMLRPINDSPADGYTLENTNYLSISIGAVFIF